MQLRPYQKHIVEKVETGWLYWDRQLVCAPTGSGKTILFSALASRLQPGKTLILAHREELIDQAIDKLHRATGIKAGKEKAESSASLDDPVVVASIQTMVRRLDKWPADHFSMVVADEAHHAISDSWLIVLRHFVDHARILGVTATPDRGDQRNLGEFFESVAAEVGLFDLINDGYLAPIGVKSVPLQIDLRNVKIKGGDFDEASLGDALEPYLEQIALAIKEHAAFRKVLAFLPLRATSRSFVGTCNSIGLVAEHIDGESPDRRKILANFAAGKYDVLSNAMLLTEGFDDPSIDCIVVLRPTKSRPLYSQMVGRGTRIHEHKDDLLLLDFLWMQEKHKLIRPAHLIARNDKEAEEITVQIQKAGGGEMDLQDATGDARSALEEKLRRELAEKSKRKAQFMDPKAFALMMGNKEFLSYEPTMKWETKPVTKPQRDLLEVNGFNVEELCSGEASKLIDMIMDRKRLNLASPKQIRMLKAFGVTEPENMTAEKASWMITKNLDQRRRRTA